MAAVAQAQQVTTANATQSLACVKSLLKLAVYQIMGLRGLFPDDAFVRRNVAGLDNMMELKAQFSDETRKVYEWIELGVNDALQRRILQSMILTISSANESPVPEVLEQFVFDFRFTAEGAGSMGVSTSNRAGRSVQLTDSDAASVTGLKKQACAMVRQLVAGMATLTAVPDDRVISIQLTYNDAADPAYEPPGFQSADQRMLGGFPRKPMSLPVGALCSDHHTVSLEIHSVLDGAEPEPEPEPAPECLRSMAQCGSQQQPTQSDARMECRAPHGIAESTGYDSDITRDGPEGEGVATTAPRKRVGAREHSALSPLHVVDAPMSMDAPAPASPEVVAFCTSAAAGAKLDALSLAARFPSLSVASIEASLAALAASGVLLHVASEDRFVRAAVPPSQPPVAATRRSTRGAKGDAPVADLSRALARLHAADAPAEEAPPPLPRGAKKRTSAAAETPAPPTARALEDGSQPMKRTRKMSAAEHPIRQRKGAATAPAEDVFSAAFL